jgi:hypothetical protein
MAESVPEEGEASGSAAGGSPRLAAAAAQRAARAVRSRCCCSRGGLVLLDTAPGHRFIVDRIGRDRDRVRLKIRIGRIDGSIFGKSQLRNVAVADRRACS